jgi:solute carrier family 25 protein 39/40
MPVFPTATRGHAVAAAGTVSAVATGVAVSQILPAPSHQSGNNPSSGTASDGCEGAATDGMPYMLSLWERMVSASAGALLTSLLATPFDVVKTRLQADLHNRQAAGAESLARQNKTRSAAECEHCLRVIFNNGLMEHEMPADKVRPMPPCTHQSIPSSAMPRPRFTGTLDALVKIARHEGVGSLYNGLPPTLLMAVPATVLYFATYDSLRQRLHLLFRTNCTAIEHASPFYIAPSPSGGASAAPNAPASVAPRISAQAQSPASDGAMYGASVIAPLLAGSGARIIAATAISPLELMRTRMQSINNPPSMLRLGLQQVRESGVMSLWRGLSPTLWRDVPFSAIYWVCVEQFKLRLIRPDLPDGSSENISASFIAGAGAGMIAATVTTPFDVIKTQRQMISLREPSTAAATMDGAGRNISTIEALRRVVKTGGPSELFVGLMPRLAKVMPACAIMLGSYEYGKLFFARRHEERNLGAHPL